MDRKSGTQQPGNRPGTGATQQGAGATGGTDGLNRGAGSAGSTGSTPGAGGAGSSGMGSSGLGSTGAGSTGAGARSTGSMGTGGAGASGVGTSGMGTSGSSATSRMDDSMNQNDESGVGGKARKLAHDAKEKATDATRSQLTAQKSRAADSLGVIAESLRTSGDRLRERHEDGAGKLFNEAADQLQRFAGAIEGRDVNEMVGEVERFARRQPAVFLGGAFAIGLISARFFKSSGRNAERSGEYPRDRYDTRGSDYMLDREVPTAPVIDPNPTDASARSTTTGRTPELGT